MYLRREVLGGLCSRNRCERCEHVGPGAVKEGGTVWGPRAGEHGVTGHRTRRDGTGCVGRVERQRLRERVTLVLWAREVRASLSVSALCQHVGDGSVLQTLQLGRPGVCVAVDRPGSPAPATAGRDVEVEQHRRFRPLVIRRVVTAAPPPPPPGKPPAPYDPQRATEPKASAASPQKGPATEPMEREQPVPTLRAALACRPTSHVSTPSALRSPSRRRRPRSPSPPRGPLRPGARVGISRSRYHRVRPSRAFPRGPCRHENPSSADTK